WPIVVSTCVFTLAKRIVGSSAAAAWANCGPITLHGPHHGAQKSTNTGTSPCTACWRKLFTPRSTGCPANKGLLQCPHKGLSVKRCCGTRLSLWHWGQAIFIGCIHSSHFFNALNIGLISRT